jgi:hypothetical protein
MKQKINFDDLKRLHDGARIAKVGSREWIEFATTMLDEFPAIYDKAKSMNATFNRMRNQVETGKQIVQQGIDIMDTEQVGQWTGVRSFLEQETDKYLETPNAEVRGCPITEGETEK